jgi:hypothetical protein
MVASTFRRYVFGFQNFFAPVHVGSITISGDFVVMFDVCFYAMMRFADRGVVCILAVTIVVVYFAHAVTRRNFAQGPLYYVRVHQDCLFR